MLHNSSPPTSHLHHDRMSTSWPSVVTHPKLQPSYAHGGLRSESSNEAPLNGFLLHSCNMQYAKSVTRWLASRYLSFCTQTTAMAKLRGTIGHHSLLQGSSLFTQLFNVLLPAGTAMQVTTDFWLLKPRRSGCGHKRSSAKSRPAIKSCNAAAPPISCCTCRSSRRLACGAVVYPCARAPKYTPHPARPPIFAVTLDIPENPRRTRAPGRAGGTCSSSTAKRRAASQTAPPGPRSRGSAPASRRGPPWGPLEGTWAGLCASWISLSCAL